MAQVTVSQEWLQRNMTEMLGKMIENTLPDYDGQIIFDTPILGMGDGDAEAFSLLRGAVGEEHFHPRALLSCHARPGADLSSVTVVSWALPFAEEVRRSNRREDRPSRLYSLARNNGGAVNHLLRKRMVLLLREKGLEAVAPAVTRGYNAFRSKDHVFSSNWSERHVAWAAGLGVFGLNGCLITSKGTSVRFGSVVTNLQPPVSKEDVPQPFAPCLEDKGGQCGRCIARCPVGAISRDGLDKSKCYAMRNRIRREHLSEYEAELSLLRSPIVKSGKREQGYSLGCALCMHGVPCEDKDPQPRTTVCSISS